MPYLLLQAQPISAAISDLQSTLEILGQGMAYLVLIFGCFRVFMGRAREGLILRSRPKKLDALLEAQNILADAHQRELAAFDRELDDHINFSKTGYRRHQADFRKELAEFDLQLKKARESRGMPNKMA